MIPLLGEDGRKALAELATTRVLIAFDYDGTLAPVVADRDRAVMRPRTRRLFAELCALYPCAVISGRALADVARRVAGSGVRHVVGNHGLEPSSRQQEFEAVNTQVRLALAEELRGRDGLDIEDKRLSLAVHYRRAASRAEARRAIAAALERVAPNARTIPGKAVVNVLPEGAPNKGDALRWLKALEGASTALYVGDDVTDEDVFELEARGEVVAARVGRSSLTAAAHFLADQREVDLLLELLGTLRGGGAATPAD
jgi:trehalose 6-phosphate phosphatase